ncbi:chaplin [Streptomyces sp. NPDC060209]|uniref:chaplin n=1 Tax=Streptomyces sp. NPDC060209 TaxID=3347073 RepID=UPI003665EEDE
MKYTKVAAVAAGTLMALGAAAPAMADSGAGAVAAHSPGVLSGNVVQVPINIPINICGNTLNLVGALNPAFGNACINR